MRMRSIISASFFLAAVGGSLMLPAMAAEPSSSSGITALAAFQKAMPYLNLGNYAKANKWLLKAANMGQIDAQNALAYNYANGRGVKQDYTQAAEWYRKAAERGDAGAQAALANLYAKGQGVKKDLSSAYELMALATINEQSLHIDRDKLASKLTKTQRAAADARVKAWKIGNPLP